MVTDAMVRAAERAHDEARGAEGTGFCREAVPAMIEAALAAQNTAGSSVDPCQPVSGAAERERDECDECDELRRRMGDLLTRTAVALRGPPPGLVKWGWADLPERAAAAIAAIDVVNRAAAALAAQGAEPASKWLGPCESGAQAIDELRRACAEIIGADPETWPTHGNAPLAIAAALGLRQAELNKLAAQPTTGWIACSERMPPNDAEPVLAIIAPRRRYYLLAGDVMNRSYATSRVTHWMPLPKPPETLLDVAHRLIEAEAERISARAKLERDKGSEQ